MMFLGGGLNRGQTDSAFLFLRGNVFSVSLAHVAVETVYHRDVQTARCIEIRGQPDEAVGRFYMPACRDCVIQQITEDQAEVNIGDCKLFWDDDL